MWGNPRRDIRASDADRERVIDDLRVHTGDGRLTVDELTERIDRAYAAKTLADLDALLVDLPPPSTRMVPARGTLPTRVVRRRSLPYVAAHYALLDAAAVVIWFVTGRGGDFWPIWVIILTALLFARRAIKALERRSTARRAQIEGRGRPGLGG
jgi:Domain of unknown function (DUF1707)